MLLRLRSISKQSSFLAIFSAALFVASSSPASAQSVQATHVRVLAVADTHAQGAAQIGLGVDGNNVQRTFQEVFSKAGKSGQFTFDLFNEDKVTPLNILNYYKRLKPNPSEVLVFYYTGHGITDKTQGHLITTHRGYLPRRILIEAMGKTKPQMIVLLTDCCANYKGTGFNPFLKAGSVNTRSLLPVPDLLRSQSILPQSRVREPRQPTVDDRTRPPLYSPQATNPLNPTGPLGDDLLSHVFYQHRGLVDINAAQMGKSASGNVNLGGSYFTLALTKALRKSVSEADGNDNNFVEWNEFFSLLDTYTRQEAARAGFYQRPQAFTLPKATN